MKIVLQGTLKSMRDKSLNKYKKVQHNNKLIRAEQEKWLIRILDYKSQVRHLFLLCAKLGVKLGMEIIVYRNKPILDYKNIVGGFDHAILDGWVHAGMIKDDNTGYLDYVIAQRPCEKDEDRIEITLFQSEFECSRAMRKLI